MGWRFRKSVKLIPGVRLNFTKNGISTTIGGRGAHTTFGRGRVTNTFSIPGTGISHTSTSSRSRGSSQQFWSQPISPTRIRALLAPLALLASLVCFATKTPGLGTFFLICALFAYLPSIAYMAGRFIGSRSRVDQAPIEAAALAESEALSLFLDKVRVLLFLARDDGVVRAKERDVMVAYLSVQPNAANMNDEWLKKIHAKMPRDTTAGVEEAVTRLGTAGVIDSKLIEASEALVTLTKAISPMQLTILSALRRERGREQLRS